MQANNEIARCIETALYLERKSYDYYHEKYRKLKEHLFRNLLLFLANQEKDHIKQIDKFKKLLMKKYEFKNKERKIPNFFKHIKRINHRSHEIEILHAAMELEKNIREFYIKQEEKINEKRIKNFFRRMAKFEDAHYKLLDGLYESFMYVRLET